MNYIRVRSVERFKRETSLEFSLSVALFSKMLFIYLDMFLFAFGHMSLFRNGRFVAALLLLSNQ